MAIKGLSAPSRPGTQRICGLPGRVAFRPPRRLPGIDVCSPAGTVLPGSCVRPGGPDRFRVLCARHPFSDVVWLTSWKDPTLFSLSQAGMVNNHNDAMVWGLVPIILAGAGLPLNQAGVIAAVYPGEWGIGQRGSGPPGH